MTKEELLNQMKASREHNTMGNTKLWREAFKMYNEAHGTNLKASDGCGKCFNKVAEWLNS
jgi:hypothetical protein